jgi:hypothetical protein
LNRSDDDAIVVVELTDDLTEVEKASDAMIVGLQIRIRGEELSRRMAERIRAREEAIAAIERRIEKRAGDHMFDAGAEDRHVGPAHRRPDFVADARCRRIEPPPRAIGRDG